MPEFGPLVAIVRVTVWSPVAPAAIGGAEQVIVASGTLQTKVMGTVVVPVGVTVKVEDRVLCPESSV
jgi:hypothetical protein